MRADNSLKAKHLYEFGPFRLDTCERVIRNAGRPLSVAPKALDVLITLIENRGKIVEKDDLMRKVWGETFVEENNLAFNVSVLRKLFEESPASPSYIETVPRRGYRFIGQVVELTGEELHGTEKAEEQKVASPQTPHPEPNRPRNRTLLLIVTAAALVGVSTFLVRWLLMPHPPLSSFNVKVLQLTTNSAENPVSHAVISPDGKYLVYGDLTGMRLLEISTGQTHALPRPDTLSNDDGWFPAAWMPDGIRIVASSIKVMPDGKVSDSIWLVSVLGGKPLLIRDDGIAQAVSPDGSLIAFTRNRGLDGPSGLLAIPWSPEIWVMGQNGEDARRVVEDDGKSFVRTVQWSPDSNLLAYVAIHFDSNSPDIPAIETIPVKGGRASVILPNFPPESDFCWIPTGRILYTRPNPAPDNRNTNLWELKVDSKTGNPLSSPRQISNIPGFNMSELSVSFDGRKLAVHKVLYRSDIYIGRLKADGRLEAPRRLTYDERSNLPFAWTLNSKSVIFTSDRTGVNAIYKQDIDSDLPELISTGPETVSLPRVTPDGSSLVYFAEQNISFPWESRTVRVMRLPIAGGARRILMEFPTSDYDLDCPTQPGVRCIVEERPRGGTWSIFYSFDPSTGDQRELFRGDAGAAPAASRDWPGMHKWTISPDGAHLAETDGDNIEVSSIMGKRERTVHLDGSPSLASVDWSADGKAFWVSHDESKRTVLSRVTLDGHAELLWNMDHFVATWAISSPDGRYLAIMAGSQNSNAWLFENF